MPLSASATTEMPDVNTESAKPTTLKRSLSLPLITLYGLGTIIGAGIYVLIGEVAGQAGLYAPIAFLLAAVIAAFTAFSYAELVSRFPRSAAEAVYVKAAFNSQSLAALTGWSVVLVGVVSSATIANGFVGYLGLFATLPDTLIIVLLVIGLGLLAAWGISESVWVAATVTILEIGGLLLVLGLTGDSLAELPQRWPELMPGFSMNAWLGIMLGAFLAFFAFIGFEDMVNVAEEVKNPQRNLPLAIILALVLSSTLYILVALVATLALVPEKLAGSEAPLALLLEHRGYSSTGIGIISLIAVVNGALIQIIMGSRMVYGMAQQHGAPALFAKVNGYTRTPVFATALITLLVLVMALWLPLVTLAKLTSYITLLIFAAINLALWRIKVSASLPVEDTGGSDKLVSYPLWVPIIGASICVGFLLLQTLWTLLS